jgi:hypothetical protein
MPNRARGTASWQADCRLARAFAVNLCAFGAPFGLRRLTACTAKRAAHHAKKAKMYVARIWTSDRVLFV